MAPSPLNKREAGRVSQTEATTLSFVTCLTKRPGRVKAESEGRTHCPEEGGRPVRHQLGDPGGGTEALRPTGHCQGGRTELAAATSASMETSNASSDRALGAGRTRPLST